MKKWLIGVLIACLVLLISCQLFIPRSITVQKSVMAKANLNGVYRFLSVDSNWLRWWPGEIKTGPAGHKLLLAGGYEFSRTKLGFNSFEIELKKDAFFEKSNIVLVQNGNDSLQIDWSVTTSAQHNNPLSKVTHFFNTKSIGGHIQSVLNAMNAHVSQVPNIYGVNIKKEKFAIEYLISKRKTFTSTPTNADIYGLIEEVRGHIQEKKAVEEGHPMFHIEPSANNGYELLVGLPVHEPFEAEAPFMTLRLLKGGNVLVSEVRGGQATADAAMKRVKVYADDHKDLNVALPFHMLITDRRVVADTSQWITRVNYPCL